jgi:hypothetical protein
MTAWLVACGLDNTHPCRADVVWLSALIRWLVCWGCRVTHPMHAATCMRLPSRPWCLPPQLCVRKHTCSSAAQCSVHAVYTRLAAASGGSVLVKAAAGEASDVVADLGVESQPEPAPTPAAVTADSADSTSASEPSLDKPKRVPWNKGRKHLPGTCIHADPLLSLSHGDWLLLACQCAPQIRHWLADVGPV